MLHLSDASSSIRGIIKSIVKMCRADVPLRLVKDVKG